MSHDHASCELLILSGADVRRLMPMKDCIGIIEQAMRTVSSGGAELPLRVAARVPATTNLLGVMPGYLREPASLGAKVIAVYPASAQRRLSSHMGVVVLFDPREGVPIAIVDAASITRIRTAAASAVATHALARSDADELAVLGTGEQASAHVEAISCVRKLRSVRVWGRSMEKATAFAQREGARLNLPIKVSATVEDAVAGASIVCTTTSSREPMLDGAWIEKGAHVNLVGASIIDAREADETLVTKSSFYVDFRPSAMLQAGELRAAMDALGVDAKRLIRGEIGEVLNGKAPGRASVEEVTVYKSLGIAAQDLATAHAVYERAQKAGLGVKALI
jgi:ornithine cyclodeaminase